MIHYHRQGWVHGAVTVAVCGAAPRVGEYLTKTLSEVSCSLCAEKVLGLLQTRLETLRIHTGSSAVSVPVTQSDVALVAAKQEAVAKQERAWITEQIAREVVLGEVVPNGASGRVGAPGKKFDEGKPRYDLVPWGAFSKVVDVLTYGAKKYGAHNWLKVSDARNRYFAAAQRHLIAWQQGELNDPQTENLPHLACAICSLLFLLAFDLGTDDTPKPQETSNAPQEG